MMLLGAIPLYVERDIGGHLDSESFGGRMSGVVPLAWRHWREDDWVSLHPALWVLDAQQGDIGIMVTIEPKEAAEDAHWQRIIRLAQQGSLFFSYGYHDTPGATRAAAARWQRHQAQGLASDDRGRPLRGERIGHWSVSDGARFPQAPARLL